MNPTTKDEAVDTRQQPAPLHEQLADLLDELHRRWRKADRPEALDELDGSAAELARLLQAEMPDRQADFRRLFSYSSSTGVLLGKLLAGYPALVRKRTVNGVAHWTIFPGGWGSFWLEREGIASAEWP